MRYDTNTFIEKAKLIHGDRYDYHSTEYVSFHSKLAIVCNVHGSFLQAPAKHLYGGGCAGCAGRKTSSDFVKLAKDVHGDRYVYDRCEYKNPVTRVTLICKTHGEFQQLPREHIRGAGCRKCSGLSLTTEEFISEARQQHGDRYDYSQVKYKLADDKIIIGCHRHGNFQQVAWAHKKGRGCPKCSRNVSTKESQWLDSLGVSGEYRHKSIRIDGYKRPLVVDAYDPVSNTVYEFYGDLWHGNPKLFEQNLTHRVSPKKGTYGDLYRRTVERENRLRAAGYNLETIWENDWDMTRR